MVSEMNWRLVIMFFFGTFMGPVKIIQNMLLILQFPSWGAELVGFMRSVALFCWSSCEPDEVV